MVGLAKKTGIAELDFSESNLAKIEHLASVLCCSYRPNQALPEHLEDLREKNQFFPVALAAAFVKYSSSGGSGFLVLLISRDNA